MTRLLKDILKPLYLYLTNRYYRANVSLFSKYSKSERHKQKTVRFLDYTMDVPDPLSFIHQYKEIFLEGTYKFTTSNPSPVIYDCGANVGLSCIYFKKNFPGSKIKVFEADPEIFKIMRSNVERNAGMGGIELYNKAVWINNDGVEFVQDGADGGSIVTGGSAKKVSIPSVRLRDLLEKEKVDFLKIDIEGAEIGVLLDCNETLKNVSHLFFEYHSYAKATQELDKVLQLLSAQGFRYFIQSPHQVMDPFINSRTDAPMDLQLNVYCFNTRYEKGS